jgi:hypothetical protein
LRRRPQSILHTVNKCGSEAILCLQTGNRNFRKTF